MRSDGSPHRQHQASHFDVIVLGTQLAGLASGALLAKRGFRVLVLGDQQPEPTYELDGVQVPNAPVDLSGLNSPIARRILRELGAQQSLRSVDQAEDGQIQIATPDARFEPLMDPSRRRAEIEREFPAVATSVERFHEQVLQVAAAVDQLVEHDLAWPPNTLWERREFSKASAALQRATKDFRDAPLSGFPERHPFRCVARVPLQFGAGLESERANGIALARHYAAWLRGPIILQNGVTELRKMLLQRIEANSGEVRTAERADHIELDKRTAVGVRLAQSEARVGCDFLLAGVDLSRLSHLLPDASLLEPLLERFGEPHPRLYRYRMNVVVDSTSIPAGMGQTVFYVVDPNAPLVDANALRVERLQPAGSTRAAISVEALLPSPRVEAAATHLPDTRLRVLTALEGLLPFIRQQATVIDSPHDGYAPSYDATENPATAIDRSRPGPRAMQAVYAYPVTHSLGLGAMPVRTPIDRLLLCSRQIVPSLGQEGELLAAWSAARLVTRADRKKARMRHGLWTKVNL